MISKHLYKDFLEDGRIYTLARNHWKSILGQVHRDFLAVSPATVDKFRDSSPFRDGNPIFSARFNSLNKLIRIVQERPENSDVELSAWIEETEVEELPFQELVICLEMSPESVHIAKELIEAWVGKDLSKSEMLELIDSLFIA